ncbi:MAG: nuclear transport factor 2 family protein [Alphaproteobacteria bacterium]
MNGSDSDTLRQLADRAAIRDTMCRYARGVDRGDEAIIRSAYHPDAHDDHVDYSGDIDGFIAWLGVNFKGYDNSMHFLGQCLIEFAGPDLAMVETYYASRRLRPPEGLDPKGMEAEGLAPGDMICRQSWGRYLDRFERRDGEWRIARRTLVIDNRFTSVAKGGARQGAGPWGTRDTSDPLYAARTEILGDAAG